MVKDNLSNDGVNSQEDARAEERKEAMIGGLRRNLKLSSSTFVNKATRPLGQSNEDVRIVMTHPPNT